MDERVRRFLRDTFDHDAPVEGWKVIADDDGYLVVGRWRFDSEKYPYQPIYDDCRATGELRDAVADRFATVRERITVDESVFGSSKYTDLRISERTLQLVPSADGLVGVARFGMEPTRFFAEAAQESIMEFVGRWVDEDDFEGKQFYGEHVGTHIAEFDGEHLSKLTVDVAGSRAVFQPYQLRPVVAETLEKAFVSYLEPVEVAGEHTVRGGTYTFFEQAEYDWSEHVELAIEMPLDATGT